MTETDGKEMQESSGAIAARIAPVAHEANRAYCATLGDFSQRPWDESPQWQRDSAVAGVKAILANPSQTPEQSHESWAETKMVEGWTYGPVKDVDAKTHPCLVPYDELPLAQQRKDALFVAVVKALL